MILHGDCIELMAEMESDSVDAIVTDPPYAIAFMSREFDTFDSPAAFYAFTVQWAVEALRVLKPGGSLLSFGGTRTHHRMMCGIEDAGFIIKDCLMWLYGQGFPKAQDLGKMIDKRLGAEREVVGKNPNHRTMKDTFSMCGEPHSGDGTETAPASDLARHWDGYKIGGIKPAWEPIIWAVKPPEGAWIDNVLRFGTGAVNVGECRIAYANENDKPSQEEWNRMGSSQTGNHYGQCGEKMAEAYRSGSIPVPKGRFPANLLLDESAAALLDEQSGVSKAGTAVRHNIGVSSKCNVDYKGHVLDELMTEDVTYGDTGGASRFFYCAKATDRQDYNDHPTLKPTDLIEWLIRLVTRPGQTVLDPFAGSGTTGVAAIHSAREFILIEQDEHYIDICERRTTENVQGGMF